MQVRLGQILESGKVETKRLGRHHGLVYKLAVLPGDPNVFYSCGEDGFVQHVGLYIFQAPFLAFLFQTQILKLEVVFVFVGAV